jgi:hypothetical protein
MRSPGLVGSSSVGVAARRRSHCGPHPAGGTPSPPKNGQPGTRSGETSRRQLLFCKESCRQPEKILLPPELTVFPTELSQFSPLLAGELTLIGCTEITTVDAGLANPLGQAAVGQPQPLRHSRAAEPLTEAKGNGLLVWPAEDSHSPWTGFRGPRHERKSHQL